MANMDKGALMLIIGIFISVILGLSLQTTVNGYAKDIETDANASEIVQSLAPFIGVIWLAGCFGIAGALGYAVYNKIT